MSVSYAGLIQGNFSPIDVARMIQRHYGGDRFAIHLTNDEDFYQISFIENYPEEVMALRPWKRGEHAKKRLMSVHINGACKGDYAAVTSENMTYVSLGHWGECREIIDPLVRLMGGWVKDECGPGETNDKWVRLEVLEAAREAAKAAA